MDIQTGSGAVISHGDMISVRITRQVLSDSLQVLHSQSDGCEVIIVGSDSRSYVNEAVLGIKPLGAMRHGGIRTINNLENQSTNNPFVARYRIEAVSILHHLPIPHYND